MNEEIKPKKSNTFLNKVNNSFNIIKDRKKNSERLTYYLKEKPNLLIFLFMFYSIFFLCIFMNIFPDIFNTDTNVHFPLDSSFINVVLKYLMIVIIALIIIYLMCITLIKIESYRKKHKDSLLDKLLNKFERSYYKDKKTINGIIFYISRILIILFIFIAIVVIPFPYKLDVAFVVFVITSVYFIFLTFNFLIFIAFYKLNKEN